LADGLSAEVPPEENPLADPTERAVVRDLRQLALDILGSTASRRPCPLHLCDGPLCADRRHGDWTEITERGTAIIHGRSVDGETGNEFIEGGAGNDELIEFAAARCLWSIPG
jgi:hypothetical protein